MARAVFDAAAEGDRARVLAHYDPEVEYDVTRAGISGVMEHTVYHGHDGVRRLFREWYEAWDSVDDVLEELIDAGNDVVSVVTIRGLGGRAGWRPRGAITRRCGRSATGR